MKMKNSTYDILKDVCLVFIPATAVFVTAITGKLGLAWGDTAAFIIEAFGVYLGSLLKISSESFYKNELD